MYLYNNFQIKKPHIAVILYLIPQIEGKLVILKYLFYSTNVIKTPINGNYLNILL